MTTYMILPLSIKILLVSLLLGGSWGCRKPVASPLTEKTASGAPAEVFSNLAPLGHPPDWESLSNYAGSITESEVQHLLETHYALPLAWLPHIELGGGQLSVRRDTAHPEKGNFYLKLAPQGSTPPPGSQHTHPAARYWLRPEEFTQTTPDRPLAGVKIALDPGHIGGEWATMEERQFRPDTRPPVQEGNHTLLVGKLLHAKLAALGATVSLVREKTEPVTSLRPTHFIAAAKLELLRGGIDISQETAETPRSHRLKWTSEKLFYRTAEIRERARLVNDVLRPDFVICLHFDASKFEGGFSPNNHFHMLMNGAFSKDELLLDDQRHEMLARLLGRIHESEFLLSAAVARGLVASHRLPPFTYTAGVHPVPGHPYLWVRNLLANRLYRCPVAYCEPYVMNNATVYERLIAGDFAGEREIRGKMHRSIYQEYAEGVASGIVQYVSRVP